MLRHPVKRAISHYYFLRSQQWTLGSAIHDYNLTDFLTLPIKQNNDWSNMMAFRGFWQDGQASVAWLTSTHIAKWVHSVSGVIDT